MKTIHFFTEDISFAFNQQTATSHWIQSVAQEEGYHVGEVNIIFCSDEYLYAMNQRFLQHDTYTDIITFDHSDEPHELSGELYISIDRIRDNAQQREIGFETELYRVIVHGILHLIGYNDKTDTEKEDMRSKEEQCLHKPNCPLITR